MGFAVFFSVLPWIEAAFVSEGTYGIESIFSNNIKWG
jgi:hypothetical protein